MSFILDCILQKNLFIQGDIRYQLFQTNYFQSIIGLLNNRKQRELCFLLVCSWVLFLWMTSHKQTVANVNMMKVTDKIKIPCPTGNGQHGSSRFMTKQEIHNTFAVVEYNKTTKQVKERENYGLVLGIYKTSFNKLWILSIKDDQHALIIGSTRCGKTRGIVLQTVWLRALAQQSMIVTDPKGELFIYSKEYLKKMNIETIVLDFRQCEKSFHYNYLEFINQAINTGDIPSAIDNTWDLVSCLVGVPKGEPLWTNGESATIAASILFVSMEAPEEYRNLPNVYHFIRTMCVEDEMGQMPINKFMDSLPKEHPAKSVFGVAEISPEKMRGSFFGSALATLRLFTNWNIADVTSKSDFDVLTLAKKPTALFLIVPDETEKFYPLVSLFISQTYTMFSKYAYNHGGRLPTTVDFLCDEFGNFPMIPSFGTILSVAAGRGIRFWLIVQDYEQLYKKYKEEYQTIKANCETTVLIKTSSIKTQEELSRKTDKYTCRVNTSGGSVSGSTTGHRSYSSNSNLQGRSLLTPGEIGMIQRPYSLVFQSGCYPAILHTPDLKIYPTNEDFGMGSKEHNLALFEQRDKEREKRDIKEIKLWNLEQRKEEEKKEEKERISFLD